MPCRCYPGLCFPEVLEWGDARLAHTYVLPEAALAEVARPTAEALARSPAVHFQRGTAGERAGQLEEAIAAYRQCVALDPTFPHARYHLGVALGDAAQYDEAVAWLQQVLAAEPERAEAYNSLGYCYSRLRQPAQAVAAFERAMALQPDSAQVHVNLGMTLLQLGDYARGFAEYEWRWQTGQVPPFQCPHPRWDGSTVPTRTLLIQTEQGAGDAIQFARYLPLAAQRFRTAGTVTVAEFDTYLPLLSLPRVCGTTWATIPAAVPYVDVAALRRRKDATVLSHLAPSTRPKVGLVWAGSPTYTHDRQRS